MTSLPPAAPLSRDQERLWATLTHVSALIGLLVGAGWIGWLGPLIVYLVLKDRSAFVRQHAATTLNFQIAMLIAVAIGYLTLILLIGFAILVAVLVLQIVFSIIAAVAANRGEPYTYPIALPIFR